MNFPELSDSTFSSHFSSNFLHTGNYFLVSPTLKFCVLKADSAVGNIPQGIHPWGTSPVDKGVKWDKETLKSCVKGTRSFLGCLVIKAFPLWYEFSSSLWEWLAGSFPQCPQIAFFSMGGAFLPWFLVLSVNHGWVLLDLKPPQWIFLLCTSCNFFFASKLNIHCQGDGRV